MPPLDALSTYGLLTASILALWFRSSTDARHRLAYIWIFLFLASLVVGFWAGYITTLALPFIAAFLLSAYLVADERAAHYQRRAAIVAIIVLSAGFMAHVVPGFVNYKVISHVTFSEGRYRTTNTLITTRH